MFFVRMKRLKMKQAYLIRFLVEGLLVHAECLGVSLFHDPDQSQ